MRFTKLGFLVAEVWLW